MLLAAAGSASAASWEFLVYGDTRSGTGAPYDYNGVNTLILGELATRTVAESPAFVLVTGDLVNSGNLSSFQTWQSTMSSVYNAGIGVMPVAGNHDTADLTSFKSMFITGNSFLAAHSGVVDSTPGDGRSWAFTYSGALFLGLDNYTSGANEQVNQSFVNAQLAARNPSATPLLFGLAHEPAFKVGPDNGMEQYPAQRNTFWSSMQTAGARQIFFGHDHLFTDARMADNLTDNDPNNDIHQVVVGTGGAPFHTLSYTGNTGSWTAADVTSAQSQYGYVRDVVDDTAHTVTQTWVYRTAPGVYQDG